MKRIIASETLVIGVLTVLFAGDFYRNLLTVTGWVALAFACAGWAFAVLAVHKTSWRILPRSLALPLGWIALSPLWSPYFGTSIALTVGFFLTISVGVALSMVQPLALLWRRAASALRIVLGASLAFELVVALSGRPLYPVGMATPPGVSIELAWCRGLLFDPTGRIQGIVGNANLLGTLALLLLVIAVVRLSERPRRPIIIADVVLGVAVIAKTGSSTVLIAVIAVMGVWALAWLARRPGPLARAGIGVTVAGALTVVVLAVTNWPRFAELLGKSADMTHRFDIWAAVAERIAVRPVTGFGFVGWWPTWEGWFGIHAIRNIRVTQAHNLWLDLTMQVGVVGLVLFAAALVVVAWRWWRRSTLPSVEPEAFIALGFVVVLLVQSLTESRALSEWGIALVVILAINARSTPSA